MICWHIYFAITGGLLFSTVFGALVRFFSLIQLIDHASIDNLSAVNSNSLLLSTSSFLHVFRLLLFRIPNESLFSHHFIIVKNDRMSKFLSSFLFVGVTTFHPMQFQPRQFQPLPFQPLAISIYCIFNLPQFRP